MLDIAVKNLAPGLVNEFYDLLEDVSLGVRQVIIYTWFAPREF